MQPLQIVITAMEYFQDQGVFKPCFEGPWNLFPQADGIDDDVARGSGDLDQAHKPDQLVCVVLVVLHIDSDHCVVLQLLSQYV